MSNKKYRKRITSLWLIAILVLVSIPLATPALASAACPISWDILTVDSTEHVGYHTSLAFDADGYPAISYFDNTNDDLKLAYDRNGDGDFTDPGETLTVDSAGSVGHHTSLAFDADGYPAISYHLAIDATNGDLKLAYDRNGDGDFTDTDEIITVDSDGVVGEDTSLAFDADGNLAISYYDFSNRDLKLAYDRNGDGDFLDTDEILIVDSTGGVGWYTSLAFDATGNPAISYCDATNQDLKLAYDRNGNGDFTDPGDILTVDSAGDVGLHTSMAFNTAGNPAISYHDKTYYDLKLAYDRNNDGDFLDTDEILTVDSAGIVGRYTSLAFDADGNPTISYHDFSNQDLKLAYDCNGDGDFLDTDEIHIVDSSGDVGLYTSLAFDADGNLAISYYDATNHNLKLARYAAPSEVWVDDDWAGTSYNDDPDGAGPATAFGYDAFDVIQDGIDSVASPGTVHVAAGTYYETISITRNVDILGAGEGVTIIDGGAIASPVVSVPESISLLIDGFTITNNETNGEYGLWSDFQGGVWVSNCTFLGAGMDLNVCMIDSTVTDCTFSGCGMHIGGGGPIVTNCTFSGPSDYGIFIGDYSYPTIANCTFSGYSVAGMYTSHSWGTVTDCTFSGNTGDGMYNYHSDPTVTNCTFASNLGHGMAGWEDWPTVTNCVFSDNSGWGMYLDMFSDPIVTNCTFYDNSSGGVSAGNWSHLEATNCIFWDDTLPEIFIRDLGEEWEGTATVTYSVVQDSNPDDGSIYTGLGNIDDEPLFYNPAAGDFHLQASSPCIDAGDNDALPADTADLNNNGDTDEEIPFDFEGDDRRIDDPSTPDTGNGTSPIVDMGADEYQMLPHTGPVIYVDLDAAGNHNGTSWADALNELQYALTIATPGKEIWVSAGTYNPLVEVGGTGDRNKTFQMKNGVEIYGGFPNSGSPSWADRDWEINETILSGDLNGDDTPGDLTVNRSDNCYHVFYHPSGTNLDGTAVLDGFTISGGHADGGSYQSGGGMLNVSSSPTVTNCTFSDNYTHGLGGGMFNSTSSPIVTDCTFSNNDSIVPTVGDPSGGVGGGMFNHSSSPLLTDCTFSENSATNAGGGMFNGASSSEVTSCTFSTNSASNGGGMFNNSASPLVTDCTFYANLATNTEPSTPSVGGGMSNWVLADATNPCEPTMINCIFYENTADDTDGVGGGMINCSEHVSIECTPTVTNCTFVSNTANQYGSGMGNYNSSPVVTNCILGGVSILEEIHNDSSSPVVTYSNVEMKDPLAVPYPGDGNIDAAPLFADAGAGDFHLQPSSPCIDAGDNSAPDLPATDFEGDDRRIDDPDTTPDTGNGTPPIVDMGADEFLNTPSGSPVVVSTGNATITFDDVTGSGSTTVAENETGPAIPSGYEISSDPPVYYDVTTTASYSGTIEVCFEYDESVDDSDLHLFHYHDSAWEDVTSSVDTVNNVICGEVTSLSEFIVAAPAGPSDGWSIPMTAEAGAEGSNGSLELGVHPAATDGYDSGIDIPHPPAGPGLIDAYFEISDPVISLLDKDYRGIPGAEECTEWTLIAQTSSNDINLSWDSIGVPPDVDVYMNIGTELIDMKTQSSTVLPAGNNTVTIRANCDVCIDIPLKAVWNMVSVPVIPADNSVASVFPGAEVVYAWDPFTKSYYIPTEIEPDKGYWVAVLSDTVITVCGSPVNSWTDDMTAVWNMIGSVSSSVDFTNPDDDPDGSVEPFAYQWDPVGMSYVLVTTIDPTKGHWIAATQECTLTLTSP